MQDWKLTDKILAISDQIYEVWKMQDNFVGCVHRVL